MNVRNSIGNTRNKDYFSVIFYSKVASKKSEYKIIDKNNSNEVIEYF